MLPYRDNVPLAPLTTLGMGGPATRLVDLEREQDVVEALRDAEERGQPVFVLGGGSNVVVADAGFPGVALRMRIHGMDVRIGPAGRAIVDAAAGEGWDALVARAVAEGWSGVECMSGIPGLVGATPIQNVGAYGQEVGETITQVRAYDRVGRTFVDLSATECLFAYRSSAFRRSERWVVTRVRFELEFGRETVVRYSELARHLSVAEGARAPARVVRDAVIDLRRAKGMVVDAADPESVSVGSFFVNPVVDARTLAEIGARAQATPPSFDAGGGRRKIAAAWLVERAGFAKGWGTARAGVSRKHALALVNRGGASARELLDLAREIQRGVLHRFGVRLEPEPVLVGCLWE